MRGGVKRAWKHAYFISERPLPGSFIRQICVRQPLPNDAAHGGVEPLPIGLLAVKRHTVSST